MISDIQSKKVGRGSELMGTWKFGTPADPTQVRLLGCAMRFEVPCGCAARSEGAGAATQLTLRHRPQFLASNGWRADLVTDRARIAAALDLDAALLAFELEKATRSQFIAASVLPQQ